VFETINRDDDVLHESHRCGWCHKNVYVLRRIVSRDDLIKFISYQHNRYVNVRRVDQLEDDKFEIIFTHHCVIYHDVELL